MKKILIYISLFIILTTSASFALESEKVRQADEIPPYYLSFASIGAIFQESRLDGWAKIDTEHEEADIEKVCAALGCRDTEWSKQINKKSNNYFLSTNNTCYMIFWEQDNASQAFLKISIKSSDPYADLTKYEKELTEKADYNWHFNYTYTGQINSIVDDHSMQVLMDTLILNLKGRQTNNYRYGESWSATAISDKKAIIPNCNRFESALRRDKNMGKTKICLGIPSIQGSY